LDDMRVSVPAAMAGMIKQHVRINVAYITRFQQFLLCFMNVFPSSCSKLIRSPFKYRKIFLGGILLYPPETAKAPFECVDPQPEQTVETW